MHSHTIKRRQGRAEAHVTKKANRKGDMGEGGTETDDERRRKEDAKSQDTEISAVGGRFVSQPYRPRRAREVRVLVVL